MHDSKELSLDDIKELLINTHPKTIKEEEKKHLIWWFKKGDMEFLRLLNEGYYSTDYFDHYDFIEIFKENNLELLEKLVSNLDSNEYWRRKISFEIFEKIVTYLNGPDKVLFLKYFTRIARDTYLYSEEKGYERIKPLIALMMIVEQALFSLREFVDDQGHWINDLYYRHKRQKNVFDTIEKYANYPYYLEDYKYTHLPEEDASFLMVLAHLVNFIESREDGGDAIKISDNEFVDYFHFVSRASQFMDHQKVLNNFSKNTIEGLFKYAINKLRLAGSYEKYYKILKFIEMNIFSIDKINLLNDFPILLEVHEKSGYSIPNFEDILFFIYDNLKKNTLDEKESIFVKLIINIFKSKPNFYHSFILITLNDDYDIDPMLRKILLDSLKLIIKTCDFNSFLSLLENDILITLEDDILTKILSEMKKEEIDVFLSALHKFESSNHVFKERDIKILKEKLLEKPTNEWKDECTIIEGDRRILEELERMTGKKFSLKDQTIRHGSRMEFCVEEGVVTELGIYEVKLNVFPNIIQELNHLRDLSLVGTRIKTLPKNFINLSRLKRLCLSDNKFTFLPENIGSLSSLELLIINNIPPIEEYSGILLPVRIERLPDSIGDLKSLKSLNLLGNHLRSLPRSIGNLINLNELIMMFNYIEELPESIGKLKNLKNLDLRNNLLLNLPESMKNLSSLEKIWLKDNPRKILAYDRPMRSGKLNNPDWLYELKSLKEINGEKLV